MREERVFVERERENMRLGIHERISVLCVDGEIFSTLQGFMGVLREDGASILAILKDAPLFLVEGKQRG